MCSSDLREPVESGRLLNALQHMWGYVKGDVSPPQEATALLASIRCAAVENRVEYLLHSTALCELALWI